MGMHSGRLQRAPELLTGSGMKLIFPMPPNLANSRMHWRTKHNAKKSLWAYMDVRQIFDIGFPKPPREPMAKATISSVMYLGGAMDDDNAMNRHKWLLDWLKSRGYIMDDRKKCLTWAGLPEQVIDRKNQRIEITLTPLTPTASE